MQLNNLNFKDMKKLILTILSLVLVVVVSNAQKEQIPLIGEKAPSFTAKTTNGKITFPDNYGSSWKILFSHPRDFTPVCTSELLELAYMHNDFDRLNVKVAVISTDRLTQHEMWKAHLEELDYKGRGVQKITFPLIDDERAVISKKYGMLHTPVSTTEAVRGVFIIDDKNVVRSINFYPMQVGRNMNEIVRIVEALQTVDQTEVLTPANWSKGDDVLVPYFPHTDAEIAANPELKDDYYMLGNRIWFKKIADK